MEKSEKLEAWIRGNRRSVGPDQLQKLMEARGFEPWLGQRGGHICLFQHRIYPEITASMNPKHNPVLVKYVTRCLRALDRLAEREEML